MRKIRVSVFMIVIILICIGLVMVYSASALFSYEQYHSTTFLFKHHLFYFLIGAVLTALVMSLDLHIIRRWAKPLFIFSVIILILVFVPALGRKVGGARRWLKIGMFGFQPSEFAKWATILFLSDILSAKDKTIARFSSKFILALIALGVPCALLMIQPDLGGALTLAATGLLLLFIAGMSLAYIAALILLSLPTLYFSIFSVPYRRRRILAFLNPWADARGIGFQIIQSYLALGLGGLVGLGLGQSRQKLLYLPAAHTDFIFSIIGEELGLVGTTGVVVLFMLFLWQGLKISLRATDNFIKLLSFGIIASIVLSAGVHMAAACGAIPTKGLPLPFISYGGSALIFNMLAVGVLLNCARDRYFQEQKL